VTCPTRSRSLSTRLPKNSRCSRTGGRPGNLSCGGCVR
jgi:hypothetical protein